MKKIRETVKLSNNGTYAYSYNSETNELKHAYIVPQNSIDLDITNRNSVMEGVGLLLKENRITSDLASRLLLGEK